MSNDIIFNRGRGGLGRALAGKDHICGIVAVMGNANIPTGMSSAGNRFKTVFSLQDAADLGIAYADASDNVENDALRYALERIFDVNEKAIVHLIIASTTDEETAPARLIDLQNNANGEIRQALVLDVNKAFAAGDVTALQASCDVLEAQHKPLSVVYSADFLGNEDYTSDLRALDCKNVSVCIAMDGAGLGSTLSEAYTKSFTAAGSLLGALSLAKVHENIGWVGRFDLSKNISLELDTLKLADGRLYKDVAKAEIDALGAKGYILLLKHIGRSGSYFNDSHTAITASSDYAYIENTRTIDKAVRGCREFLLPNLNSPLYVNEDGTLTEDTIATFKNDTERALEAMQVNGEVSAFSVTIDPAQNVLTTSKLTVTIKVVPVGVARNIVVNIGFAIRVTNQ